MKTPLFSSPRPAPRLRRAFSLIELLAVISVMGLLAGMLVGLAPQATARIKESRTRAELERLITAIETYKSKFGVYPPDNVIGQASDGTPIVDPVINPLFYELTGSLVVRQGSGGYFVPLGDADQVQARLNPTDLENIFHRDGFVNAAVSNNLRRLYRHDFKDTQRAQIKASPDIELLVAPVAWPANDAKFPSPLNQTAFPNTQRVNPWRYVSSNPTNNPASFDLWAEVIIRGQRRIIGNWRN
jgi:prepilin-type N-terminal cleavage/methylation domain-containing protein